MSTRIVPIAENIYGVETECEPGVDVRALLVAGHQITLLIDTLNRPADLDPVADFVASLGRPVWLANSHADWDHWWGNARFADASIVAHRLTLQRQQREGRRSLAGKQRKEPGRFDEVILRHATVVWEGELDLDLGDMTVQFRFLPGHTHDCTVAYIPERRLLFAGDTVEDPIPLINEGPVGRWAEHLRVWAEQARTVVPAHGPVTGVDLMLRNAAYLEALFSEPDRVIPELASADAFYKRAHRANLRKAADEAGQR